MVHSRSTRADRKWMAISIGEMKIRLADGGSTNFANLSDPGFRIHGGDAFIDRI